MASGDKSTKTQLIAIYRLEFYKNKKNWKLYEDVRKEPPPSPKTTNKLNKTYNVGEEFPEPEYDVEQVSAHNKAFLEDGPDPQPPDEPPPQPAPEHNLYRPHSWPEQPWSGEKTDALWQEDAQPVRLSEALWQEDAQLDWSGEDAGSMPVELAYDQFDGSRHQHDLCDGSRHQHDLCDGSRHQHDLCDGSRHQHDLCDGSRHQHDVCDGPRHQNDLWTPAPHLELRPAADALDQLMHTTEDWMLQHGYPLRQECAATNEEYGLVDEFADFMRGAHATSHSSEINLSVTEECACAYDGLLYMLSERQLARAVQRHHCALVHLLGEQALRERPYSQSHVHLPSPYEDCPTRDTDPFRPDVVLSGSHNVSGSHDALSGFPLTPDTGRGRGRLQQKRRVIGIGMGRPYRL